MIGHNACASSDKKGQPSKTWHQPVLITRMKDIYNYIKVKAHTSLITGISSLQTHSLKTCITTQQHYNRQKIYIESIDKLSKQ